ncbi:MAG: hypothetical protein ACFFD4_18200, partial [Candidatus Odinarchaeota archaeon]
MDKSDALLGYACSKCGKQPPDKEYLLKGCSCGNGFFRVVNNNRREEITEPENTLESRVHREMIADDIAQVEILDEGVFLLDIDSLFKNNGEIHSP